MYTKNQYDKVISVETGQVVPTWDPYNHLTVQYQAFLTGGGVVSDYVPPSYDPNQIKISLDTKIQDIINVAAKAFGYDSIDRAVSYLGSTVPLWKDEATALNAYRDAVWSTVIQYLVVHGYPSTPLTDEQLAVLLPAAPVPWVQKF